MQWLEQVYKDRLSELTKITRHLYVIYKKPTLYIKMHIGTYMDTYD